MIPAIIVHGGAGAWDLDSPHLAKGLEACKEAAAAGQALLLAGHSALDAVEAAVRILEDCPVLDAGTGSHLTTKGTVEMDALIMDGRTLDLGCVAAVRTIQNPISLARQVMERTDHAILVGEGASHFADTIGWPRIDEKDLITADEWKAYLELKQRETDATNEVFVVPGSIGDTVGAVAIDRDGNLAVATSTGGTRNQLPGRVGDSPLVGSGGYADNETGAVGATGHGESLMKVVISKQACDFMGLGMTAAAACEAAIKLLAQRIGPNGRGGLIAIDRHGRVGVAFNTDGMPFAHATGEDEIVCGH